MKKTAGLFVLCVLLVGCMTSEQLRMENQRNLTRLSIGMSKKDVMTIMGDKVVSSSYSPFTTILDPAASNPYRTEILQGKEKTFEVLYYYTDIKKNDRAITDDELTPLVFDNGKLIGWGWGFLEQNVQKYEIRFR